MSYEQYVSTFIRHLEGHDFHYIEDYDYVNDLVTIRFVNLTDIPKYELTQIKTIMFDYKNQITSFVQHKVHNVK